MHRFVSFAQAGTLWRLSSSVEEPVTKAKEPVEKRSNEKRAIDESKAKEPVTKATPKAKTVKKKSGAKRGKPNFQTLKIKRARQRKASEAKKRIEEEKAFEERTTCKA